MPRRPRPVTAAAAALAAVAACLLSLGGSSSAAAATSREQVTPFVAATSAGPHALEVTLIRSKFQTKIVGYKIYLSRGADTPGGLGRLPSRSPDRVYAPAHVPTQVTLTLGRLKKLVPYTVVAYGYDKAGHVGGSYALGYAVDDGFHVTGTSFYLHNARGGAFVLASKGRERILGVVHPSSAADHDTARQVYAAGKAGSSRWTHHAAPGHFSDGRATVQLVLGTNGKTVDARLDACGRAGTAQASVASRTIPVADNFWTTYHCEDAEDEPVLAKGIVPLPDNKVLVAATANPGSGAKYAEYLSGRPNGTLSATKLPEGDSYYVTDVARDASTGEITILGTSQAAPYGYVLWQGTPAAGFSEPAALPAAPARETSMAAGGGKLFITFDTTSGVKLLTRAASRQISLSALPHTTKYDALSLLYFNAATGHLHAAWTRAHNKCIVKCSGIMHQTLVKGHWGTPRFFTHWHNDYATSIQVSPSDHTLIGYLRE